MDRYHLRRSEKAMTDPAEIRAVIEEGEHVTLALAKGDEPYLITIPRGPTSCFRPII